MPLPSPKGRRLAGVIDVLQTREIERLKGSVRENGGRRLGYCFRKHSD